MKLWQKIYILTICLFVILLNAGIYLVFDMTYRKDLSSEQRQAESEYHMIASGILRNLRSLDGQGRLKELPIRSVLEIHEKYFANQEVRLTFWKDGRCIYPEGGETPEPAVPDGESRIWIWGRGEKTVGVQSLLYESRGKYYLRYEKALSELDASWEQLERKYLVASLGFSLGLAALLFVFLRRMMKPIGNLTQTVDEMRLGNLSARVGIKGSDDISLLGEHFNEMAEKIQKDISFIEGEVQAKQELVDNFSHELKSPITSIYGFAEYIQKAKVSEQEMKECMGFIMEESARLLKLSYTLLDLAQMRGKEIGMQRVSIRNVYEGIRRTLEKLGADCGVNLRFLCGEEMVQGNEILLQSLLYNLIHNGICACREGGMVTVREECLRGRVCLTVEDNGCGMTEEEMERITEPFYRADQSRNREDGRTGLGLSLCQKIVDLHGAEMNFLSEKGKGTKVLVLFP